MSSVWDRGDWVDWMMMRVDLHVDTLWRLEEKGGGLSPFRDDLQIDARSCHAGAVRLLCTAVFTEDNNDDPWGHCNRLLDVRDRLHDDGEEPFQRVVSPREVAELPAGQVAMLATIENALCIGDDLSRLEVLHQRGARILGITWNGSNLLGQGVMEDEQQGLTDFGKDAVALAAELGWAVDVSHLNREGVIDVCESGVPVLATHSNARAVHDHPRNLSDELLSLIAEGGGLVGVNLFPPFLAAPKEQVNLDTVVRHIHHLMEFFGEDRVGLGSDLDGISKTPVGFTDHGDLDALAAAMGRGGISEAAVNSILGDGFIRWWSRWSRQQDS